MSFSYNSVCIRKASCSNSIENCAPTLFLLPLESSIIHLLNFLRNTSFKPLYISIGTKLSSKINF